MVGNNIVDIVPHGGNRFNGFAFALQIIGAVLWSLGGILGLVLGAGLGNVSSTIFGGSRFMWVTAIVVWSIAFLMGLFPFCFAEIISLLQKNTTLQYLVGLDESNEQTAEKASHAGVEPFDAKVRRVPVAESEQEIPFRPIYLTLRKSQASEMEAALSLQTDGGFEVAGVMTDIDFVTFFEERYRAENVSFLWFKSEQGKQKSRFMSCGLSARVIESVKGVRINVKKYLSADKIYLPGERPAIEHVLKADVEENEQMEKAATTRTDHVEAEEGTQHRFCPKCGNEVNEKMDFCGHCGSKLR